MWRREGRLVTCADEAPAHLAEDWSSKNKGKDRGTNEEREGSMPPHSGKKKKKKIKKDSDQQLALIWSRRGEGIH